MRYTRFFVCTLLILLGSFSRANTIFGPESLSVQTTEIISETKIVDLGGRSPGLYLLKVKNGRNGPYRAFECEGLSPEGLKRQCMTTHLGEKVTTDFLRFEGFTFKVNGRKHSGNFVGRQFSYREILINLDQPVNELILTYQGYPSSELTYEIEQVDIDSTQPKAYFTVKQVMGTAPLELKVYARESFDPENISMSYSWDFGDGQTGVGQTATHSYQSPGTYLITLNIRTYKGKTAQFSAPIIVTPPTSNEIVNKPPLTRLLYSFPNPSEPRRVQISFDGSYDTDGYISNYEILYGDGSKGTEYYTEHVYPSEGAYLLIGKTTDNQGGKGTFEKSISVYNPNTVVSDGMIHESPVFNGTGVKVNQNISLSVPSGETESLYKITLHNADGQPHPTSTLCNGVIDYLLCTYQNWINQNYVEQYRVDWAHIYLNNLRITASGDISNQKSEFQSVVKLKENNVIMVQYVGKEGSFLDIKVEKLRYLPDGSAPQINVYGWQDVSITNNPSVSFQVQVSDESAVSTSIYRNGTLVQTSVETSFDANLSLVEGENIILIKSKDQSGAEAIYQFNPVYLDRTLPVLLSSVPSVGSTLKTNSNLNWISGISNEPLLSVNTNFGSLTVLEDGKSFSGQIFMPGLDGKRTVTIVLEDLAGNLKEETVYVDIERNPPSVVVIGMKPFHKDDDLPVFIKVTDQNDASISVYVNNTLAFTFPGKELSYNIPLSVTEGTVLKVVAVDEYGNSKTYTSGSIQIDRVAPTLSSTYPFNNSTVTLSYLELSGVASESLAFASINGFPFTISGSDTSFSGIYPFSVPGPQVLNVLLRDIAGNESVTTLNFEAQFQSIPSGFTAWDHQECPIEGSSF